jgi:hypothetical protein
VGHLTKRQTVSKLSVDGLALVPAIARHHWNSAFLIDLLMETRPARPNCQQARLSRGRLAAEASL